ncbi:MAG: hypothetical protein ACRD0G_11395 [Acidimicrobiales bacterium]
MSRLGSRGVRRYLRSVGPFIALLAAVVWFGRLRSASAATILVGVVLGIGLVVAVVVASTRDQGRTRASAAPGQWAGLAAVRLDSLAASPTLTGAAPRRGLLSAFIFSSGTVSGRLFVGDEVRFEPGRLGRWFGATAFELRIGRLRDVRVVGRSLTVVLRDGSSVEAVVVRPAGLREAGARLLR